MSDSEDENYVTYGVPLDPLDEENLPRKKPVTIEDQYAYDAQGRRRFHGAFTGGFSAGYFNTVGTRDGWRPQQFKSSRSSKAESVTQRPEDFMDEEDTSQFGIAPKVIRATSDYADHSQRGTKRERLIQDNIGPIPGSPVLRDLLKPVKETVGITLLKKMGWKPGQGVGSRVTKKEKTKIRQRNQKIRAFHEQKEVLMESNSDDSDNEHAGIMFAPDDYEPFRCNPKDNYFGIGYSGLDKTAVLSGHVNLFDTPVFSVQDKNKKLSIHGQAFGVGAFEADDEDIYAREDMSRYDFAIGPESKSKTRWSQENVLSNVENDCLEGFLRAKNKWECKKVFTLPDLPKDFTPVHAVRKSRFYPPIIVPPHTLENGKRKNLNAADRARILEDTDNSGKVIQIQSNTSSSVASNIVSRTLNLYGKQQVKERQALEEQQANAKSSWMDKLSVQNFVKGGVVGDRTTENLQNLEEFKNSFETPNISQVSSDDSKSDQSDSLNKTAPLKPFLSDPDKQRRFEQYLVFLKSGEKDKLESMQPLSMTKWDRDQESTEFEQAAKLCERLTEPVANKSVDSKESLECDIKNDVEDQMKQAAKMTMFGKLTRERVEWKPASIVCKRFNIPEPKVGCAQPDVEKKSAKFSIFDSLDWCNSSKFLKATDTIPKQLEGESTNSSTKTESVSNLEINPKTTNDISFTSHEAAEPVSEKMRNFEASYEKVFGKGMQNASTTKPKDTKVNNQLEKDTSQTLEETCNVSNATATNVSKDKSEEKKDLFKAIFLSSSEDSESEPEENVDSEVVKSVLIGKSPAEVNTQRNTSPPRGIFAKIDLDNLLTQPKHDKIRQEEGISSKDTEMCLSQNSKESSEQTVKVTEASTSEIQILPDVYGPMLPERLLRNENSSAPDAANSQVKPVFKSVVVPKVTMVDSRFGGKWVEREKVKKSKKEKKKHKHKEHKSSKHKRKSKKEKR